MANDYFNIKKVNERLQQENKTLHQHNSFLVAQLDEKEKIVQAMTVLLSKMEEFHGEEKMKEFSDWYEDNQPVQ